MEHRRGVLPARKRHHSTLFSLVRDTVKRFSSAALPTVRHPHQHSPKLPQIPARFCNISPYLNPAVDRFRCCLGHQLSIPGRCPEQFTNGVVRSGSWFWANRRPLFGNGLLPDAPSLFPYACDAREIPATVVCQYGCTLPGPWVPKWRFRVDGHLPRRPEIEIPTEREE